MRKVAVYCIPADVTQPAQDATMSFAEMQEYVKHPEKEERGIIESVPIFNVGAIFVNENGIALGLPRNSRATLFARLTALGLHDSDYIKGDAVIVGPVDEDGEYQDIDEQVRIMAGLSCDAYIGHRPGMRVGAILSASNGVAKFLGYGTYDGDFEPPEAVRSTSRYGLSMTSPRITLDTGEVVWGMQCWWAAEDVIREQLDQYERVEMVTMADALSALRKGKSEG